ncbi:dihydroorotate dehydrogenase electron transfer subunit [Aminipila luticellarii]|uniref:Dihydroorotate dehydrogenase electron transfer subunit n=1 Tax=Aminipila luticellarii TaxID=2507160 RepID=A0A410PU98_9FIRM|nr:dihydroorotate dehydrogenase electron transfer subunit [Aminipila luticellarii]QAT42499.1 dihydroorotate dehydrogenase electron transfer subunit [Aminipila luticellarii]
MKKVVWGNILCNDPIAKDVYKMQIQSSEMGPVKAGQFVNIYLEDKSMLLPRPLSICDAEEDSITIVYRIAGKGTRELSAYQAMNQIRVSTPLGNGYFIEGTALGGQIDDYSGKTVVVAGGGIGVPPMVLLARRLKEKGAEVLAAVGFQEEPFLIEELKQYCREVHVATDRGTCGFHGNAVQMIKEKRIDADEYFSCGPKVMLKALSDFCTEKRIHCQVSLEERMGCGYGACVGCTCKIKVKTNQGMEIQQKGVCKHGPVFFGEEVVWDE